MFRHYAALVAGVVACSTSAVMIKASTTEPAMLCALRLVFAAIILSPLAVRAARNCRRQGVPVPLGTTLVAGLVLAAHVVSWTYGARMTLVAQSSLIVNLVPIAMPFFLHFLVGERITRGEVAGTALAILGVLVLSAQDALAGTGSVAGNAVCFGSMILFAWYLALGRRNRAFPSLWLYVVPVYAFAALGCFAFALPRISTFDAGSSREWLLIGSLVVLPTLLGHSLLNYGMRHLRGQVVVLWNTLQFVFAAILGWFAFSEKPGPTFYLASAITLAGVLVVVLTAPRSEAR